MKQKSAYNKLLLQYKKYVYKLERFEKEGKNEHRQKVLKNHIAKLLIKLKNLFKSIQKTSAKEIAFASVFLCGMIFTTPLTAQTFTFTRSADITPFDLGALGSSSFPTLADLDGDGDLDLMSGEYDGNFYYFANTGNSSAPAFGTNQENHFMLSNNTEGYSAPTLDDLDGDGDLDLISGSRDGNYFYFENTGSSSAPDFSLKTTTNDMGETVPDTNPFGLSDWGSIEYSFPALADLDGDGDLDLISGEISGAFHYFENTATLSVEETTAGLSGLSYNSISGTINNPNGILLKNGSIFDITGRELQSFNLESLEREQEIPAFSNLPQGIYILKISSDFGVRL